MFDTLISFIAHVLYEFFLIPVIGELTIKVTKVQLKHSHHPVAIRITALLSE